MAVCVQKANITGNHFKPEKGNMKKLLMALSLIGLLAGCASRDNMGGTSSDEHNNANNETGASAATNNASGNGSMSQ